MPKLTIDQAMQIALQHHQAGQLQEAEQIYRQVLAQLPEHAVAMHNLGLIAHQAGRDDIAIELIRRAILLAPNDADAHSNLGKLLKDKGEFDDAIAACRKAITLRPNFAEAYNNLGNALVDKKQFDEAVAACKKAITLNFNFAEAHNNLGNALAHRGLFDEAISAYRQAVALRANYAEAHSNLGAALADTGQFDAAIAACRQAIALCPTMPEAHNNLGSALKEKGQLVEAIAAHRQAIALRPGYADAHLNLGITLGDDGQVDEAIAALRQAVALRPDDAEAHLNLGIALDDHWQSDEAIAALRHAISLEADYAEAHNDLGNALKNTGRLDEAIAAYRRAVALQPGYAQAHSNLVYTLQFHAGYDAAAIFREHRSWNEQHAKPLLEYLKPHANDASLDRRLRIGYVSPDFRMHVVGRNLLPLFQEHDRDRFAIICYSNVLRPDDLTTRFRSRCDGWRNIVGVPDQRVAELLREDRIDILVDLTLHISRNRLLVFARKPAPVQVTFAGYPGTTGLQAMDYRLTDPYLDPVGQGDDHYSERSIRLSDSFWCYDPAAMTAGAELGPQASALPALPAGQVTFGCLNNFCKVNDRVLALWARALKAVAGSRLILRAPQGSARQQTLEALSRDGIDPATIEFVSSAATAEYLKRYGRIDIGLDTFPYNGHTTSLDALWMGVPVVTLVGATVVGRAGLSQLTNLGLTELVARSEDQYVQIAADLAHDLPRLSELRARLRQRMRESVLTDARRFARNIEAAYREMWRRWCQSGGEPVKDD